MKRQSSGDNTGNFKSQDALMQDKMKYELKRYEKLHKLVIKSLEEYLIMLKNAKFQELSDTLIKNCDVAEWGSLVLAIAIVPFLLLKLLLASLTTGLFELICVISGNIPPP